MRTFHTGGVAVKDITHGLPRGRMLFEWPNQEGNADIRGSRAGVRIEDGGRSARWLGHATTGRTTSVHVFSRRSRLPGRRGRQVAVGQQLIVGS